MVVLYIVALYYARSTRFHSEGGSWDITICLARASDKLRSIPYNVSSSRMSESKAEFVWSGTGNTVSIPWPHLGRFNLTT